MVKDNKHEFALFYSNLSNQKTGDTLLVTDAHLVQRITSILRLKQGDRLTLFNDKVHMTVALKEYSKKSCSFLVEAVDINKTLLPVVTVLLPLLKRDALETALYSCVALGATHIQLVETEKTRKWQGQKELERLQRIVIAAVEQSKNFDIPTILKPCSLQEAIQIHNDAPQKLFADPAGVPYLEKLSTLEAKKDFLLMVGPEGDLTSGEKELLKKDFISVRLVSTILKSEQALALLLGVARMAT